MAALAETVGLDHLSLAGLPTPIILRFSVPLGDEELIAFSRRNRPFRIERNGNGELEVMSPVGFEGGQREDYTAAELYLWSRKNGGVSVGSNTGFTLLDSSVRSPDAGWISDDRLSSLTEEERRAYAPLCPEFLIEILSESDSLSTLQAKMDMWISNGAQLAWLIVPFAATLSIYRPGQTVEIISRPDSVEADLVVPGFRLDTNRLWAK